MTSLTIEASVRQAHGYVDFWKVACQNRVVLQSSSILKGAYDERM